MNNIVRLHKTLVDAGLPIEGLRGEESDIGPWTIQWKGTPTLAQTNQAASIMGSFDTSPAAKQAYLDSLEPFLANIRDQAQQAVADIDAYLVGADTATAAQVRAEVKAIDQRQKKVIQALLRVVVMVWRM